MKVRKVTLTLDESVVLRLLLEKGILEVSERLREFEKHLDIEKNVDDKKLYSYWSKEKETMEILSEKMCCDMVDDESC